MRSLAVTFAISIFAGVAGVNDASAAGQRSFVSGSGVDTGACTLTAPCRSFGYAIGQTNAEGEVIVLDSAGYGPVTITKSVTIAAPPGVYAGISVSSGDGVTVNAGAAASVVLRGLALNNQGGANGIVIQNASATHVEACVVTGFVRGILYNVTANTRVIVAETVFRDNARGIDATGPATNGRLEVVRSRFHSNGGEALKLENVRRASVADSYFGSNNSGISIGNTGAGTANTSLAIERTVIVDNLHGLFALDSGTHHAVVNLVNSTIAGNNVGVQASGNGHIRISGTQITDNDFGIDTAGTGAIVTLGTNMLYGNGTNGTFTGSLSPN